MGRSPWWTVLSLLIMFVLPLTAHAQGVIITNIYTSSDTWTVPAAVSEVVVEAWGGGGRGGSRTSNGVGGGGGGGAYSRSTIPVSVGQTLNIVVGAGSNNDNNPGGDSSVSTNGIDVVLAKGGATVGNNNATGAAGGNEEDGIGDEKYSGGKGADGSGSNAGGGGSSAGTSSDGNDASDHNGATAPDGGGDGGNGRTGSSGGGSSGSAPGGGGGGAYRASWLGGSPSGGNGAGGRVVLTYTVDKFDTVTEAGNPEATFGDEDVELTATVETDPGGDPVGDGTVTFTVYLDTHAIGTVGPENVDDGEAKGTFSLSGIGPGEYIIVAEYSGADAYMPSDDDGTLTVDPHPQAVVKTFSADAEWTVPITISNILVQAWGGGGAGGGSVYAFAATRGGAGGGGGAHAGSTLEVTPGDTLHLFVGPTASGHSGANGDHGNPSYVEDDGETTLVYAAAGSGGAVHDGTAPPGASGGSAAASEGTITISGGDGGSGGGNSGAGGDGAPPNGGIGGAAITDGNEAGNPGTAPGGAGGGGRSLTTIGSTQPGGAGAAGQIVITYIDLRTPTVTMAEDAGTTYGAANVLLEAAVEDDEENPVDEGTVMFHVFQGEDEIGTAVQADVEDGEASALFDLTDVDAGTYTIVAVYSGTEDYQESTSAPEDNGTLTLNKATPTIITEPTASDIMFSQTLASSELTGGEASVPGEFDWTDDSIQPDLGESDQSVTFTPADEVNYNTVTFDVSITVLTADQTIDFPAIPDQLISEVVELTAEASSGLEVEFTLESGPALLPDGTNLSFTGVGEVRIVASQPGDGTWHPAPDVTNVFYVGWVRVEEAFTENVTWTVPPTVRRVAVDAWGGGGAGGGSTDAGTLNRRGGGGGGGGAYAASTLNVTPAQSINLVVATAAAGAAGADGSDGTPSFVGPDAENALVLAAGGSGGTGNTEGGSPAGGEGGSVENSIGEVRIAGGNGGSGDTGLIGTSSGSGGTGGNGGGAGGASLSSGTSHGNPGTEPGGGGGGGRTIADEGARAGGSGAAGQIILTYVDARIPTLTEAEDAEADYGVDIEVELTATVVTDPQADDVDEGTVMFHVFQGENEIGTAVQADVEDGEATATFDLTGVDAGTYTIVAVYSGTEDYRESTSAPEDNGTLTLNKATPTIITEPTASDIMFSQTLASSVLTGGVASVEGIFYWTDDTIEPPLGTGDQSVTFTPTDEVNYNTVMLDVSVTVLTADQTIDFPAIPDQLISEVVELTATATSGLPVTFEVESGPALLPDGTNLSFTGVGEVRIVASQPGDAIWHPAPDVTNVFYVGLVREQITFTADDTWTVPPTVRRVAVDAWGGGGRGGVRTTNGSGGGGGGGAYSSSIIPVSAGQTLNVVAGVGSSDGAMDGGDSSVAMNGVDVVLAKGGTTVPDNNNNGAAGGNEANGIGELKFSGGKGADGGSISAGGGGSSAGTASDGNDGSGNDGGAAPAGGGQGGNAGQAGSSPGGGGGGGFRALGLGGAAGAGADGQIILTYVDARIPTLTEAEDAEADYGVDIEVELTATVVTVPEADDVDEGTVMFHVFQGATEIGQAGPADAEDGVASALFDLTDVDAGTYTIVAVYSGTENFRESTSDPGENGTLTLNKATPTITTEPTASDIMFSQALASSVLTGGVASVEGIFYWTDDTIEPPLGTGDQSVTFTPTDDVNYNTVQFDVSVTVLTADQTIDFPPIPDQLISEVFELTATATSGLEVEFTLESGPALLPDGTNLSFTGVGEVRIVASQPGDAIWHPAPDVTNVFYVGWIRVEEAFTENVTWTVPPTVRRVAAEAWGGGGAGGGSTDAGILNRRGGGGGGGGAYAASTLNVTPAQTINLVVATAAAGAAGADGSDGTPSFVGPDAKNALVLADGGSGGTGNTEGGSPAGGEGGSVENSIGEVRIAGGNGGSGDTGLIGTSSGSGGTGGNGGGAGGAGLSSGTSHGNPGTEPGGGGGGGRTIADEGARAGGSGAAGQIILTYVDARIPTLTEAEDAEADYGVDIEVELTATVVTVPEADDVDEGTVMFHVFQGENEIGTAVQADVEDGEATATFDLTDVNAGTYTIVAVYSGTEDYQESTSAPEDNGTLTLNKATPTITTEPTASDIMFSQALASSVLTGGVASVEGTFYWTDDTIEPPLGTGDQSVTFTPTDEVNYNTVMLDVSVTVLTADQTIDFPAIPDQLISEVVELTATASSGLEVEFTLESGPALLPDGTNLSFTGVGEVRIVASQPGDGIWHPAPDVTNVFYVGWVRVEEAFMSDAAWTVPPTVRRVAVDAWGGGGAGGGSTDAGFLGARVGGGGGGGAYAGSTLLVTPDQVLGIYVGQSASGHSGADGDNGNPSYVEDDEENALVRAAGGSGGTGNTEGGSPAGGAGGSVENSIGDIRIAGGNGGSGASGAGSEAGAGGAGANGGGAGGPARTTLELSATGNPGTAPGGGGGGARTSGNGGARAGGTGAAGRIILTYVDARPTANVTEWPTASAITYGNTLANSELTDGEADVAGEFDWTDDGIAPNAGPGQSFSVTFTPDDGDNYRTISQDVDVDVETKDLTVTADDKEKFYGQSDPDFTVTYDGFIAGEDENDLGGELNFDRDPGEGAGQYAIRPSGLTSGNYDIDFRDGTLTITISQPEAATSVISATDTNIVVSWTVISNVTYRYQYTDDLIDGEWEYLGDAVEAGGETTITLESDLSDIPRFFRVLIVEPQGQ